MKIKSTSFKRSHAGPATFRAPNPAADHHQPRPLPETTGHIGRSGSVSCGVTTRFSWFLVCIKFCLCPPRVYFPVLCKVWQLYDRVNGDLFSEGLCHTHVCCNQGPCPCGSPLLTCTSTGDVQTEFCLSLCGVSGSWCAQGWFESSECLWQVWGLIPKTVSPLLLSCWGFSFALGHWVCPQSLSSAVQPLPPCHRTGKTDSFRAHTHKKTVVCTRTQEKGSVTPQETGPDLPGSDQESAGEA